MNANDREVISGLTKQIELLQEQIKSMNEVMAKMLEKDNPKVETEEDRRNKLIEETRRHTEELNRKLEQRERNHNIAYKAKKLGEVVNNFGERVFTMDYLNTLSAFAIDEAYDNYFQDGNCKVGTKKLSDEELEKYEILFEGKKPKEEVKEVETDEKTKIAEGFDKSINEKDPLASDAKEIPSALNGAEKIDNPLNKEENKDEEKAAEDAKKHVGQEDAKKVVSAEEATPEKKKGIFDKLKGNIKVLKATGIVLAGIAVMLVAGVPLTAIVQAGATTLTGAAAGVVGYYAGKKSGVLK
ncbi:MAG: hypothetical protein MR297_02475 [Tenericutes bacterium]|nr:hypothetical protein [Mycoplasmatota bacterium]